MAFLPVMTPVLLQDSGPHPTGHLGARTHPPALFLMFLAWIQLSMVLPKLLPRDLASVLGRKVLHPYDMTC